MSLVVETADTTTSVRICFRNQPQLPLPASRSSRPLQRGKGARGNCSRCHSARLSVIAAHSRGFQPLDIPPPVIPAVCNLKNVHYFPFRGGACRRTHVGHYWDRDEAALRRPHTSALCVGSLVSSQKPPVVLGSHPICKSRRWRHGGFFVVNRLSAAIALVQSVSSMLWPALQLQKVCRLRPSMVPIHPRQ